MFFQKLLNLFNYLNDPYLVSNFQKYFGIVVLLPTDKKVDEEEKVSKKKHRSNDQINSNSLCQIISASSKFKARKKFTSSKQLSYQVKYKFWFYLFSFGASLGYEYFYSTFFPYIFWNYDQIITRKVVAVWVTLMYVGQVTKDIVKWPRPSSPPVVPLEPEYVMEYGMPSTHAMSGFGIPFSIVILSVNRYEFNFWYGLIFATLWCLLVCSSRVYLGMHSFLDIVAGLTMAIILITIIFPFLELVDKLLLTDKYFCFILVFTVVIMARLYPKSDRWSPARGDTCIVMGAGLGIELGSSILCHLGLAKRRYQTLLTPIQWSDFYSISVLIKTVVGFIILILVKILGKLASYTFLCCIFKLDPNDNATKYNPLVEIPCKLITYTIVGLSITAFIPLLFRYLSIENGPLYVEH